MSIPFIEDNDQTRARQEHLEALRELVGNAYPNKFERSEIVEPGKEDTITAIVEKFRAFEPEAREGERPPPEAIELANQQLRQQLSDKSVRIAGRIATPPRVMGKAAFVHLSDGVTRLQIYVRRADTKAINNSTGGFIEDEGSGWRLLELFDHGDFIGVEGYLFITKTGELSVHVQTLQFLAKALLPLPDKMHGVSDPEIKQRQRYVDLIAGSLKLDREEDELTPRAVFELRSAVIRELRRILDDHGYSEVETPMLTSKATGAAARAFETHHNALDITLYARIAPELYLKRLLVGGFEKVYELNRNFRNEGIDRIHSPEFTMLEFYWAYADANQMMDLCEQMLRATVFKALGHTHVRYGELDIDFSQPFERLTMREAIARYWPPFWQELSNDRFELDWLSDPSRIRRLSVFLNRIEKEVSLTLEVNPIFRSQDIDAVAEFSKMAQDVRERQRDRIWENTAGLVERVGHRRGEATPVEAGQELAELFETFAEHHLIQPTFITDFPKPISPLSKASPRDPSIAERFELFIAGMECANGFSELNDPREQYERFKDQMSERERGDEEAMVMDEDYIRALSYGMPPAAGIGIGIDRFVMLLTNRQSIRDVILFPHMRPERKQGEQDEGEDKDPEDQAVLPPGRSL